MTFAPVTKALVASVLLAHTLAGCSAAEEPAKPAATVEPGTYVGQVEGSDARVGVVAGASSMVVFVCGGPTSVATATAWLEGARSQGGATSLASASGSLVVERSDAANEVTGKLSGGPSPLTFRAQRVPEGSAAGIYEGRDAEGRYGVLADPQASLQGAFVRKGGGLAQQIIVIRPEAAAFRVELDGRSVLLQKLVAP